MTHDFETELRRALRPEDPGAPFTERVMERVSGATRALGASPEPKESGRRGWLAGDRSAARLRLPRPAPQWVAAAVLACAVAAVGAGYWRSESLARSRGMQARAELLQALSVTAETLGTARNLVLRGDGHES
jgi:hypothetical protein